VGVLQRFEQRIESIVSGAFARAFKAEVQPVEIASALTRECDNRAAIVSRERTMVPNEFVVELSPGDYERLGVYADALGAELAGVVRDHAAEQRYTFIGPVGVTRARDDDLDTGVFHVKGSAVAGPLDEPDEPRAPQPRRGAPQRAARQAPGVSADLDVNGTRFPLTSALAVIGRGAEADIRIDDPGVSRRHAQITISGRDASIADLGSTNGVIVDGQRVREAPLRDGSEVVLGATTVIFRSG
jgi:hypothetical protein